MADENTNAPDNKPADFPFCNVVMKGGVTSGVIYPPFISALSKAYRFKNIGGTSAGAIAAAATAAAEFGRQRGNAESFAQLDEKTAVLNEPVPGGEGSRLLHLFQPSPQTQPFFKILVAALKGKSTTSKIAGALWAALPRPSTCGPPCPSWKPVAS